MSNKSQKLFIYLALFLVGIILAFPFYWVISSSFKSRESISMNPPSFYPSKYRTSSFNITTNNNIFIYNKAVWLKLNKTEDVIIQSNKHGGYYLLLDNFKPTQYVKWINDDLINVFNCPDSIKNIQFSNVPVYELEENNKKIIIAAKMIRKTENKNFELLFVPLEDDKNTDNFEIIINKKHSPVIDFSVRLANYTETLKGPEASYGTKSIGFLTYLKNSFFISFLAVIGQILSASIVAYGFARLNFKGRDLLFVLLLATLMIPAQVTLVPLFSIYKSIGWLDTFLPLIVPHFTAGAFNVFLIRQYMITLPKELDESAIIDGCNPFQVFYKIILPNCIPVLIVVGLFTFVATWQDVMGPLIFLDNPELRTVPLGLEYFRSPYIDNRHLLLTGAVLSMFPIAVIFIIFQRYIMSGIATTGLKG
ncbi:MAG: carbohydrate ABC transporter permease [bacterium]